MKKIFTLLLLIAMGCSATQSSVAYSIKDKKYRNHKVSVEAAINLAMSAYLKGCSDKAKALGENDFFDQCVAEGRKHIDNQVIQVLDQNPK